MGVCCGVHLYVVECISCGVLYVVDTVYILWGYVVDDSYSSYMLWVTICCGEHFLSVLHNIYLCSSQHIYVVGICCGVQRLLPMCYIDDYVCF